MVKLFHFGTGCWVLKQISAFLFKLKFNTVSYQTPDHEKMHKRAGQKMYRIFLLMQIKKFFYVFSEVLNHTVWTSTKKSKQRISILKIEEKLFLDKNIHERNVSPLTKERRKQKLKLSEVKNAEMWMKKLIDWIWMKSNEKIKEFETDVRKKLKIRSCWEGIFMFGKAGA